MIKENLISYFQESISKNWDKPAFSDFRGDSVFYSDVAKRIINLHNIFQLNGISKGCKIALLGKNSSNWAISYLSIISYGAVVVPLLPDFKPFDLHSLINHSDSEVLLVSDSLLENMQISEMPQVKLIILLNSFSVIKSVGMLKNSNPKQEDILKENFHLFEISNDELAVISYTSGTTGFSKGVMLTHNSLAANLKFARNNMPLSSGDQIVSFLPLAHAYGCAFEFLFPFSLGCHITFLTKVPTPTVIIQAFSEIRPRLILSVPLVIEKIYKKQILPVISKPAVSFMLKIPVLKHILYKKIRKKLTDIFGGNFHEIVIGGAPFNLEAEKFFKEINFPFTVGYGMTECGPLISYSSWKTSKLHSSGKPVDCLKLRIDSPDPVRIVGEILVKGENISLGYYKNPEATNILIDNEGWLHTGDLGLIDLEGNVYIKGRCKNMILSSSGQNIYPEEIESALDNKFGVMESLVIMKNGQLHALIFPDFESISAQNCTKEQLFDMMKHNIKEVNHYLPSYMNISKFEIHPNEFEKTPKRSIKRFLYTSN